MIDLWRVLGHDPEKGFESVELSWAKGCKPEEIVALPEFQQVRHLRLRGWRPLGRRCDYRPWYAAFAAHPTQLRMLEIDSNGRTLDDACGDLSELLDAQPQLEDVSIFGVSTVKRPFFAPSLKKLRIEGKIDVDPAFTNLLSSKFPELVELVLFSSEGKLLPSRVVPFMTRDDLPSLRVLKFSTLAPGEDIFADVARTPMLRSLEELSIVHAEQEKDEPYIEMLAKHLDAYAHLRIFTISKDFCDPSITDRHAGVRGIFE